MLSNLCCDPFPRVLFREFFSHLFASVLRHENAAGSLGRQVAVAGRAGAMPGYVSKRARVVCLWATRRLGNRSPRSNTDGRKFGP
jgi:hypothetical protein